MIGFAAGHSLAWAGAGGAAGAVRLTGAMLLSLAAHAGAALLIELPSGDRLAGAARVAGGSISLHLVPAPARELLPAASPLAATPLAPAVAAPRVPAAPRAPVAAATARLAAHGGARAVAAGERARPLAASPVSARRRDLPVPAAPRSAAAPDPVATRSFRRPSTTASRPSTAASPRAALPASPATPAPASSRPALAAPEELPPRPAAGNRAPEYPLLARRRGQQGRVLLRLEVAPDGTSSSATVVHSSGVAALDRAARAAVARWRFQPARRGGRAVPATVEVPVVFRLDERS